MIVLNNKGQSLVLFVLLLPLLLFVGIIVIDCGRVMVEKKELDIVSEMVVRYGASNIDSDNVENKIVSLYDLNIDDGDISVDVGDDYVSIVSSRYVEGIFTNIIDVQGFRVESRYSAFIDNGDISVEKG